MSRCLFSDQHLKLIHQLQHLLPLRYLSSSSPPAPPSSNHVPTPLALPLSPSTLNLYTITTPPSPTDLHSARAYFTRSAPLLLYSSPTFRSIPASPLPEVAFLGRSNVGKSSLLNAIFNRVRGQVPAHVSKRAGRTRTINGFGVHGPNPNSISSLSKSNSTLTKSDSSTGVERWRMLGPGSLVVVDMPGYGMGSRAEWGVEALKFLRGRQQLRRTFLLVDAEHGAKASDVQLLAHLRAEGVQVSVLLSKVDKILFPKAKAPGEEELGRRLGRLREVMEGVRGDIEKGSGEQGWLGDVVCCSAEKSLDVVGQKGKRRIGIDEVRWAVLTACGLERG